LTPRAAIKVFKKESFVDAFTEWANLGVTPQSPPSDADWFALAQRIVAIDRDATLYASYTNHESVLQDYPELEVFGVNEDGSSQFEKHNQYPNEPFPLLNRLVTDQTDSGSGTTGDTVRNSECCFHGSLRNSPPTRRRRLAKRDSSGNTCRGKCD